MPDSLHNDQHYSVVNQYKTTQYNRNKIMIQNLQYFKKITHLCMIKQDKH